MGVNTGISVAAGMPMVGGGMSRAILGTALPTDTSTALIAAYKRWARSRERACDPPAAPTSRRSPEWDGSTLASLLTDESRSFEVTLYGLYDSDVNEYLFPATRPSSRPPSALARRSPCSTRAASLTTPSSSST